MPGSAHSLRSVIRSGRPWRMVPADLPPWAAVCRHVTLVSVDHRTQVGRHAEAVQAATGDHLGDADVGFAYVGQGHSGDGPAGASGRQGIELEAMTQHDVKRGVVSLPRRGVVERSFACGTRFRRLVEGEKGYASTLAGLRLAVFACLISGNAALLAENP